MNGAGRLPIDAIETDPRRFQRRRDDFASETVDAILAEGFRPEKFDPIPVTLLNGRWVIAGDGHSRLEAVKKLRNLGKLGDEIADGVPVRVIDEQAADALADTANVSRTPFSPVEEAEIFKRRLAAGEDVELIARSMHRSAFYVTNRAPLADLCEQIKAGIGKQYGMSVEQAVAFARACQRFEVNHEQQQKLWIDVLCKGDYTPKTIAMAVRSLAEEIKKTGSAGMLFETPVNLAKVISDIEKQQRRILALRRALLMIHENRDLLQGKELQDLADHAISERERLQAVYDDQATVLGIPPVVWHKSTK